MQIADYKSAHTYGIHSCAQFAGVLNYSWYSHEIRGLVFQYNYEQ